MSTSTDHDKCPLCRALCIQERGPDGGRFWKCTSCGAEIVNPGDRHSRTLAASEIELAWDGNLVSALVGEDLVVGVSGFGDGVQDALLELSENLIKDAVWVEVSDRKTIDLAKIRPARGVTIQADIIELYRLDESQTCAFVGSDISSVGVFGVGASVHEAVLALAQDLVTQGVWIEVTARREWIVKEIEELLGDSPPVEEDEDDE